MWISLLFLSLFTTSCFGCGVWSSGYLDSYSSHNGHLASTDQSSCCIFCRDRLQTILDIYAASFDGSNCYCTAKRYTNIYNSGSQFIMQLYRPPVNTLFTTLTIGENYNAYVTVQEFQNGNDIIKIYAVTDLNNPLVDNGCITINSVEEHHGLTAPQERVIQMSETTRRNGTIAESFESDTKYFVMVHYQLDFMVGDGGIEDGGTLWMTSYFANDQYAVVDFKSYTVNHPSSKSCELTNIETEIVKRFREFILQVKMETNSLCNTDLTNIRVVVHHTPDFEMNDLKYDYHSIRATAVNKASSSVEITFERLYIGSTIDIDIIYEASSNVKFHGLKKATIAMDIFYTNVVANSPESKVYSKAINQYLYGIGANVFYIRHLDSGYCIRKKDDDIVELNHECMLFKQIPYNLLALDGSAIPRCLNIDSDTDDTIVNCTKEKRLMLEERTIRSPSGEYVYNSDLKTSGFSFASAGTTLYREYQNSISKVNREGKLNNGISDVSIFVHQNAFSICTPGLKISSRCIRYDVQNNKITKYPPQINELLGMDDKSILYGKSKKGSYLTYNAKREIPLQYISPRMLERFKSNINASKARLYNRSDMVLSDDNFIADGKDYKVTYYGLHDLTLTTHVVLWPMDAGNCKDTVSKTELLALHSCKEIKKVCHAAESGVYWIGGNDLSIKKKVYCDMDTDDGGWMLITNYTITDGVYIPISSHLTSDVHDIVSSNYTKYLTNAGFGALTSYVKFDQMRFYCTTDVGNTMHLKLLPNSVIGSVFSWFGGASTQISYKYIALYNDDDAELSRDGTNWGEYYYDTGCCNPRVFATQVGNWFIGNYRYPSYKLYQQPIYSIVSQRSWWVGADNKLLCDETPNAPTGNLKYGTWKIYVR